MFFCTFWIFWVRQKKMEDQSNEYQLHFVWRGTGVISFGQIRYRWQILWVGWTSGPTRQFSGVGSVLQLWTRRACTLLLMSQEFLASKWGTNHFWEIHICEAAPLSINAILPICKGIVAARMTLCAVVNTSHPHIPETHQESRMKDFVGWRQIKDFGLKMLQKCLLKKTLFSFAQQQFSVLNTKCGVSPV